MSVLNSITREILSFFAILETPFYGSGLSNKTETPSSIKSDLLRVAVSQSINADDLN